DLGNMTLHTETVSLDGLILDVVNLYELVAEDKGVELRYQNLAPGDHLLVRGDKVRLQRALANLIDNAVKYTNRNGHVVVSAERRGDRIAVAVEDDGVGMAAADFPHIWDRLFRGHNSSAERGMGLGLSLVQAIITAHGSQVLVESQPGAGSTFSFQLPALG